jgi:hypothetical protein
MRLWRLSLLLMPGALVLAANSGLGQHPARHLYILVSYLRAWAALSRSCVAYGGFLCGLFFFETISPAAKGLALTTALGYSFNEPSSTIFFWAGLGGRVAPSLEAVFRNLRWLEREASEMLGLFFTSKVDRRSLFTPPYLYTAPLRKSFPTGGFYELVVSPLGGGLTLVRNGCA